jgi:hypothetical protein
MKRLNLFLIALFLIKVEIVHSKSLKQLFNVEVNAAGTVLDVKRAIESQSLFTF